MMAVVLMSVMILHRRPAQMQSRFPKNFSNPEMEIDLESPHGELGDGVGRSWTLILTLTLALTWTGPVPGK